MSKMFWLFLTVLILGLAVFAQVPQTISFQGRLTDITGEPLPDSDYALTFRLYDSGTGGTALWSEVQTVNTSNGLFTVMLGEATPFVDIEDFYAPLWLSVDIDGAGELDPRYQLGASPYAFVAIVADSANYSMYSMYALEAEFADTADYAFDAETAGEAALAYSVDWDDITDMPAGFADGIDDEGGSTIAVLDDLDDVNTVGVTDGQVLKWVDAADEWRPAEDVGGGSGDNWGTQVAVTDISLNGDGTAGDPLGIMSGGIAYDHLSFAVQESIEAGGGAGDDWGTQAVESDASLIGDGTTGDELGIATGGVELSHISPTGGSDGQVIKIVAGAPQWANDEGGVGGDEDWEIDAVNDYVYNTTDKIGIGTDSPDYALQVIDTDTSEWTIAIHGEATDAVTTNRTIGVRGETSCNTVGSGIYGMGNSSDAIGVIGVGGYDDYSGYFAYPGAGGCFTGSSRGIAAKASGINEYNYGVYGYSDDATVADFGVSGVAEGSNANYGVYGEASGGTTNYGGYFYAFDGATNYAGYFYGDVRITGALLDSDGDPGTAGQVLSSTAIGTDWITGGSGGVDGAGTVNKLAIWSGASNLSYDPNLHWDDTNHRLGIETTIPNAKLHVAATSASELILEETAIDQSASINFLNGSGNQWLINGTPNTIDSDAYFSLAYQVGMVSTPILHVNGSGNIGIGTTTPVGKLTVDGNIIPVDADINSLGLTDHQWRDLYVTSMIDSRNDADYTLFLTSNGGYQFMLDDDNDDEGTTVDFEVATPLAFPAFIVKRDGNVGIGTTSPSAKLDISANSTTTAPHIELYEDADDYARLSFSNTTGSEYFTIAGYPAATGSADDAKLHFWYSDPWSNKMTITGSGNVGIGTTNPDASLVVGTPLGSGWVIPAVTVGDATGGGVEVGNGTYALAIDASSSFNRARIVCSDDEGYAKGDIEFRCGNIGIGTGTPEDPLYVRNIVTSHSADNSPTITGFASDGADSMIGIIAGENGYQGVFGWTNKSSGYGVCGEATGNNAKGVYGRAYGSSTNFGIYGTATGGTTDWAGYFIGDIYANTANAGIKAFLIDHPGDPEHKLLRHYCIESPKAMVVYYGKARLDETGQLDVSLPDYFIDLADETGAVVQLTPIGRPFLTGYDWNAQSAVVTIYGDPGREVSYQVSAERDDPVKRLLVKPVEEQKGIGKACDDGKLLIPEAYGYPEEMGMSYEDDQQQN